ncbi:MAG: cation-translocating P-type ATPase [Chitinophagales bacterium]|nr:cation-translocating P-type ATPase [Chitinophagales bacterium]
MEHDMHVQDVKLTVEGMTCTNCATGISKFLERKGLQKVSVNYATAEVRFSMDEGTSVEDIKKGIEKLGYSVVGAKQHLRGRRFGLLQMFLVSAVFTLPLLLHMVMPVHELMLPWVQFFLALPPMAIGFYHFGRSAWGSIKAGVPNMDVLIIIGSSAAFAYSLAGAIMNLGSDYLFFETAATIITLVLLGNLMEHRSVEQTTTAIKELGQLQPRKAKLVLTKNGAENIDEVEVDSLKLGDILVVNTGDKVPLDGTVVWGEASLDESMISGESMPVFKIKGDSVTGGTVLLSGNIKLQVSAVGESTYLSKIIELVKSAQQQKPMVQRLADKASAVFVPVVLSISLVTFLVAFFAFDVSVTKALMNAIAVLAIACPCAMGLATPTAVMVGIGRVTKEGILIKGGRTIEQMAGIKQVVFDKTGTLTTGFFRIKRFQVYAGDEDEAKSILFSIETYSSHPLAKSITEQLKGTKELTFNSTQELKGIGIKAIDTEGNLYEAGSYQLVRHLTTDNHYDIYLLRNHELIAAVELEDELKPEAKTVIQYLKDAGIKTVMLSGDRYEKVHLAAKTLGMDAFYAERSPEQKLELIEKLSEDIPTAMVGDGINDAPALARASLGISLSTGTQIAIDSAQVILVKGDLNALKRAFGISKVTITTIKQNLFWAFAYNVVAIPIAAIGLLNPMVAAFSMAFSDVVVVFNSLRLKSKRFH